MVATGNWQLTERFSTSPGQAFMVWLLEFPSLVLSPSELNDIDSEDEELSNNELDSDEGQS